MAAADAKDLPAAPDGDLKAHKARSARAWADRQAWNAIYGEAYRWVTPYRRPTPDTSGASRTEHLFDTTAISSTFHGAGQLQQDLFPPGQPFFKLKPGPITKLVAKAAKARGMGDNGGPQMDGGKAAERDEQWFARQLDDITAQIQPFFLSGEWDNGVSELCIDLYIGQGCMLIIEGSDEKPVRYVTLPAEEISLEAGQYGDVGALFWKTKMSRRSIKGAFPRGKFNQSFTEAFEKTPDDEIELHQDFVPAGKGWKLIVWIDDCEQPVFTQKYRTQPFMAPRYWRVPGETYGRGPALLAVPTAKTLNKVMELTLKAAAIQLLGIWGYRPGGTFNPETTRLAPGQFWPMQSTGGIMGPDVTRLDVSAGKLEVSNIVLQELRTQVQAALHDDRLPEGGQTPKSAAEIIARMSRVKANYVGAFGRMIHEIIPKVVPRVIEILYNKGLITTQVKIDQLLVAIDVISPLAQALKADQHRTTVEAMQLVAQIEGPQGVQRRFDLDKLLPEMIRDLGVNSEYVRSAIELAAFDKAAAAQMAQQQLAQAALNKPKDFAEALSPPQEGQQAA